MENNYNKTSECNSSLRGTQTSDLGRSPLLEHNVPHTYHPTIKLNSLLNTAEKVEVSGYTSNDENSIIYNKKIEI